MLDTALAIERIPELFGFAQRLIAAPPITQ
jgi:hypothetical protein